MIHFPRILAVFLAAIAIAGCGSVAVTPEDITGTLVDITKTPWPGRQVLVGDTLTTTDEAGHFTVHDVSPPYDLAIVSAPHWGDVYVGMSDPTPTVVSSGLAPGAPLQSGIMPLTVVLPAADTSTVLGWVLLEATDNLTGITVEPVTKAPGPVRTFNLHWVGPPSASVRIHALQTQVDPATSAPVHYLGYDTTDLELTDQGNVTWTASYEPPPFSESPLSVTVSMPEGYTLAHTWLMIGTTPQFGTGGLIGSKAAGPEVSFVLPDLPGAPFLLEVTAEDGYAVSKSYVPGLPAGTQKLAVQVEPAPTLISPSDGATFGVGSTITWTLGGAGAPYTELGCVGGDKGPSITLWGGEDGSVIVPDLSALGLPLPHGATCTVTVFRDSLHTTVEDFATMYDISTRSLKPATWGFSKSRVVTTP